MQAASIFHLFIRVSLPAAAAAVDSSFSLTKDDFHRKLFPASHTAMAILNA